MHAVQLVGRPIRRGKIEVMEWYKVYPKSFKKNPYIASVWAKSGADAIRTYLKWLVKRKYRLADELEEKDCIAEKTDKPGRTQVKESK
jgi:hypothetical protein